MLRYYENAKERPKRRLGFSDGKGHKNNWAKLTILGMPIYKKCSSKYYAQHVGMLVEINF